jgi:hypothetical protein
MVVNEMRKGDIGTVIEVTVKDGDNVVDVSSATTKQFIFLLPDGSLLTRNASFINDGTDGKLQYTFTTTGTPAEAELDQIGTWRFQIYIVLQSGSWKSGIGQFQVYDNLE